MATQAFLTDIQAMNPTSVAAQQVQNVGKSGSPIQQAQVVHHQKSNVSQSATTVGQGQTTTIIQPAQAHTGGQQQSYIVTSKRDLHDTYDLLYGEEGSLLTSSLNDEQQQDAVTIQQGNGQTVYPQVQYLDGNDHTIYAQANGQMQSTYPEYSQTTMYAPVSGTYYQTAGSQPGVSL